MNDETKFLYRGVHARHPAIEAARRGEVRPGKIDGTLSALEHDVGGLSGISPFTSWTRRLNVARFHSHQQGAGGVVLRVPCGSPDPGDTWQWVYSEGSYGEKEVLLHGVRLNVEVMER
jgi:hypothetical protein